MSIPVQELTDTLTGAVFARQDAERRADAAVRVAEEAIKLLSPEQLGQLRRTLDALEVGDNDPGSRP